MKTSTARTIMLHRRVRPKIKLRHPFWRKGLHRIDGKQKTSAFYSGGHA